MLRHPWLLTWSQTPAALAVVLLGVAFTDGYYPRSVTSLIVALALTAVPGLAAAVVDGVRGSRRAEPGSRPLYQRTMDWIAPRMALDSALPPSAAADAAARVISWSALQAPLAVVTGIALLPFVPDPRWAQAPWLVAVGAVALMFVVLAASLVVAVVLAVTTVFGLWREASRARAHRDVGEARPSRANPDCSTM